MLTNRGRHGYGDVGDRAVMIRHHPHNNESPPLLCKICVSARRSLSVVAIPVEIAAEDFDGDPLCGNANIDIEWPASKLWCSVYADQFKVCRDCALILADSVPAVLSCDGTCSQ